MEPFYYELKILKNFFNHGKLSLNQYIKLLEKLVEWEQYYV
ncbi:hypothetical protein AT864_01439 [Anoxybacillus sp. P3H1B]|nr:hypothetical protein AT864_01439 [Anoxybacillus sp. P3H1B]MBB3905854.1 hypothetical protein [Anoxybacillus rupiensis]